MTHDELTKIGVRWLKRGGNASDRRRSGPACSFVASEVKAGYSGEVVDAMGFRTAEGMETVLVEAKASRSDFLADFKKPHRNGEAAGMGNYRYYLCPEGMIHADEVPDRWGLIWVGKRNVATAVKGHTLASHFNKADFWFASDRDAELAMLTWLMVKVGDAEKLVRERKRLVRDFNRVAQAADRHDRQRRDIAADNARLREALYAAGIDPEDAVRRVGR
jgi:hypothetical protein